MAAGLVSGDRVGAIIRRRLENAAVNNGVQNPIP